MVRTVEQVVARASKALWASAASLSASAEFHKCIMLRRMLLWPHDYAVGRVDAGARTQTFADIFAVISLCFVAAMLLVPRQRRVEGQVLAPRQPGSQPSEELEPLSSKLREPGRN